MLSKRVLNGICSCKTENLSPKEACWGHVQSKPNNFGGVTFCKHIGQSSASSSAVTET